MLLVEICITKILMHFQVDEIVTYSIVLTLGGLQELHQVPAAAIARTDDEMPSTSILSDC